MPQDITKFVADILRTPHVKRVFITQDKIGSKPTAEWAPRGGQQSPIILQDDQTVFIEGKWPMFMQPDVAPQLNEIRRKAGFAELRFTAETANGTLDNIAVGNTTWEGQINIRNIK